MRKEEIDYQVELIDRILEFTTDRNIKGCIDFGSGIFVHIRDIEKVIEWVDTLITDLNHEGVCSKCNEECSDCELGLKKKEIYRVWKIIKGDWSPDHK